MRLDEFEAVVDRTIEDLPDWVIEEINNLVVVTEEHPSPELGDVLGVYEGISLTEREEYSGVLPGSDRDLPPVDSVGVGGSGDVVVVEDVLDGFLGCFHGGGVVAGSCLCSCLPCDAVHEVGSRSKLSIDADGVFHEGDGFVGPVEGDERVGD